MLEFLEIRKRTENMKGYKYTCTDKSILANYILKYYWNYVIEFIPLWIAPNLLTLIGLLIMLATVIINLFYSIDLDGNVPTFIFLLNGISLFLYSTFDCIDGKHARRTKSSSSLGQMFDHGVDSLVSSLTAILIAQSTALGIGMNKFMFLFSFLIGFYTVTIDEYFTHSFYLGYINGPTEGIIFGSIAQIIVFFTGPELFKSFKAYTICDYFSFIPYRLTNLEIVGIIFISTTYISSTISTMMNKKKGSVFDVLLHSTTPLILFLSTILYYFRFIETNYSSYIYIMIFINLMLNFSLMNILIIFAHQTRSDVIYYTPMFYVFVCSSFLVHFLTYELSIIVLVFFTIISIFIYFSVVYEIIDAVSKHLKIYCFTLEIRKQSKRKE
ncbi:CDP-alcohol phosphatidyltransferase [Spraguea lophii 42_110]|uniref:CDP-alcohol phosphatidyltransferase n=1 Tax=Spraguea lophii (strain 42_110) TaxID=1358809 RepID=S7WAP3_SPRLO|nr:CDP-alcohol phosphatidyltransferase [Spraguea lophii 42_110]